jgi:hypothetical protein
MTADFMHQTAPYPTALANAVQGTSYRAHEGWTVRLEDDCVRDVDENRNPIGRGMTLIVTTQGYDSHHPEHGRFYGVNHYFIVPDGHVCRRCGRFYPNHQKGM